MDSDIQVILQFLHKAEKLKRELRHSWLSNGRRESVAEHTWRMALMAILFHQYIKEPLNLEKTLIMIMCHDLVEIETGDMPRPHKPDKKEKYNRERKAIQTLAAALPGGLQHNLQEWWNEFETGNSIEAQFARALDKLEVLIQHIEADISTWDKKAGEYALSLHGADDAAGKIPVTKALNDILYPLVKQKIAEAGEDVERFEKQWEELQERF